MKIESADANRPFFSPEHTAIWLVAVIGLSLSWAALCMIQQQLAAHKLLDFQRVAHNRLRTLRHGVDTGLQAMTTVRDLYRISEQVEEEEFEVFTRSLLERFKGIQALMWVPVVPQGSRAASGRRNSTDPAEFRITERTGRFELRPTAERPRYLPMTSLAPRASNEFTLGFDLGSTPFIADLFQRAEDSGEMTASGRVTKVESAAMHQAQRLIADGPNRLETYSVEMDLIEKLKRIYYFAKRMAKTVPTDALAEQAT